jgi:hypothetical protein
MHAGDEGLGGSDLSVREEDILELVVAGRQNRSTLVDLGRVEQIQHGKMLDRQDTIHTLEAEAALTIEEVGDVSLFESSLLRQTQTGQIAFVNAIPKSLAEVILQHSEFHSSEYSTVGIATC